MVAVISKALLLLGLNRFLDMSHTTFPCQEKAVKNQTRQSAGD
jgi:hypothetical protein